MDARCLTAFPRARRRRPSSSSAGSLLRRNSIRASVRGCASRSRSKNWSRRSFRPLRRRQTAKYARIATEMAKLFFVGLDGTEKSYRLQTHRPFTVGRDPGNDIILRDPKVSRHHAEVVFERGFFVLHDLASANGTYVNGKRVRVAPLTHGAKLRMGNSSGRFSEELPTGSDAPSLYAAEPYDQPIPPAPSMENVEMLPTAQHERVSVDTLPHEKLSDRSEERRVGKE